MLASVVQLPFNVIVFFTGVKVQVVIAEDATLAMKSTATIAIPINILRCNINLLLLKK